MFVQQKLLLQDHHQDIQVQVIRVSIQTLIVSKPNLAIDPSKCNKIDT